jgi:hypothetical protein
MNPFVELGDAGVVLSAETHIGGMNLMSPLAKKNGFSASATEIWMGRSWNWSALAEKLLLGRSSESKERPLRIGLRASNNQMQKR